MQFVDANVFLRFLTRDDPVKAERVKALLERAERGEVDASHQRVGHRGIGVCSLFAQAVQPEPRQNPRSADADRFAQGLEAAETGDIPAGA